MTISEKDREVAARIYEQLLYHASCGKDFLECKDCASRLTGNIAQALAQAREEARAEAVVKLGKWEEARKATDAKQP